MGENSGDGSLYDPFYGQNKIKVYIKPEMYQLFLFNKLCLTGKPNAPNSNF